MFEVSGYSYSHETPKEIDRIALVQTGMVCARLNRQFSFDSSAERGLDDRSVKTRIAEIFATSQARRLTLQRDEEPMSGEIRPGFAFPEKQVPKSEIKGWSR